MTKAETIATLVQTLAETFRVPISEPAARGYMLALEDLTDAQLKIAVTRALRESRFMPSPAELLKLSGSGRSIPAEAAEAWEAVRAARYRLDYTTSVDFGPLVNAIVRNMGGWLRLCNLNDDALNVWARKEFERLYGELADKDPTTLHGAHLDGAFGGLPVPVAIGGKVPARALPAPTSEGADEARSLVRDLAEAKS